MKQTSLFTCAAARHASADNMPHRLVMEALSSLASEVVFGQGINLTARIPRAALVSGLLALLAPGLGCISTFGTLRTSLSMSKLLPIVYQITRLEF